MFCYYDPMLSRGLERPCNMYEIYEYGHVCIRANVDILLASISHDQKCSKFCAACYLYHIFWCAWPWFVVLTVHRLVYQWHNAMYLIYIMICPQFLAGQSCKCRYWVKDISGNGDEVHADTCECICMCEQVYLCTQFLLYKMCISEYASMYSMCIGAKYMIQAYGRIYTHANFAIMINWCVEAMH